MAYDPSITQKVWAAVKSATDQFLAVDVLLAHNEKQDIKIGAAEDAIDELQWFKAHTISKETMKEMIDSAIKDAFRVTRLKIAFNKWVLIALCTPISLSLTALIIDKILGHAK